MEYDFKGGAGVESVNKQDTPRTEIKQVEIESLDNESGDALSDDDNDLTAKMEVTPTRHSARNAGKRFKYNSNCFILFYIQYFLLKDVCIYPHPCI